MFLYASICRFLDINVCMQTFSALNTLLKGQVPTVAPNLSDVVAFESRDYRESVRLPGRVHKGKKELIRPLIVGFYGTYL